MSRSRTTSKNDPNSLAASAITHVQMDGQVALKVIRHCSEEGTGGELVQGVLLGIVINDRLEVTNCFPFPRNVGGEDNEDFDEVLFRLLNFTRKRPFDLYHPYSPTGRFIEVQYQMEMMRNLRHVNVDHLHVGWYQSSFHGSFITKTFLDSQFNYQLSIEESVALIYDPHQTSQGFPAFKAYRLTRPMMELYKEGDFNVDTLKNAKFSFLNMFEEIPIVIKNSNLTNVLMCELNSASLKPGNQVEKFDVTSHLDLGSTTSLQKTLRQLLTITDDMSQEINKYTNVQRQIFKQNQAKSLHQQKRQAENQQRLQRGEEPLPEEDLNKIFKPIPAPTRLDTLLISNQVTNYCKQVGQFSSQSLGKLFMAEAFQENSDDN